MALTDDVLASAPLFARRSERAGAFDVIRLDDEQTRLVMREPHFGNNVRYVLVVNRHAKGMQAYWVDSEDKTPRAFLEVGRA